MVTHDKRSVCRADHVQTDPVADHACAVGRAVVLANKRPVRLAYRVTHRDANVLAEFRPNVRPNPFPHFGAC